MTGKYLDCSTAHITEEDSIILKEDYRNDGFVPISVANYIYGFIIFLPDLSQIEKDLEEIIKRGYSTDFIALMRYANQQGATLVVLDQDGSMIPGLHINDW